MVSDFLPIPLAILSVLICLALGEHSHTCWMLIQGFRFIALTWTKWLHCSSVYLQPGPAYLRSPHLFAKRASTWIFSVANNLTCLTGFQGNVFISPCFMYFFFSALFAFPLKPFFFPLLVPELLSSIFPFFFRPLALFAAYSVREGDPPTNLPVPLPSLPSLIGEGRSIAAGLVEIILVCVSVALLAFGLCLSSSLLSERALQKKSEASRIKQASENRWSVERMSWWVPPEAVPELAI